MNKRFIINANNEEDMILISRIFLSLNFNKNMMSKICKLIKNSLYIYDFMY